MKARLSAIYLTTYVPFGCVESEQKLASVFRQLFLDLRNAKIVRVLRNKYLRLPVAPGVIDNSGVDD
ncbi:MAG: hypothetical protein QOF63_996 [Thermoanaerobaculia bacterium]|nr:hypothetical protein [Thermoanaerobaculia bacterium]